MKKVQPLFKQMIYIKLNLNLHLKLHLNLNFSLDLLSSVLYEL